MVSKLLHAFRDRFSGIRLGLPAQLESAALVSF
jgi:hypothetical protein